MPEKKSIPLEIDLSDENLLELHLELTKLAIRGHNITESFLPPLPEHLEKRYLPKLLTGNYNPSGAPEGIDGPGEESLKQYESEYEQWQTEQCARALNRTRSQIANIEREIETGKANRILNENLDFYRAFKTQIESWFDLNYIDVPPKAEVEPKKEEAPHEKSSLSDVDISSHEMAVRDKIIKRQKDTIRALKVRQDRPLRDELKILIDQKRKGTGKVNYTKLGGALGRDPDTVKRWIEKAGLLGYALNE